MEQKILSDVKGKKAIKALEEGKNLFEECRIEKAFIKFNEAIRLNPDFAEAYLEKGEAHIGMFDTFEAEKCLLKYVELAGENERVYKDLIELYDQKANFDIAVQYCDKLISINNKDEETYYFKAELLVQLSDFENALEMYCKCIELNPNYYRAICGKGMCLYSLDKVGEAIEAYEDAIEVDDAQSLAHLEIGLIFRDMGILVKALKYLKKAYDLSPDDEWCKCQYILTKDYY